MGKKHAQQRKRRKGGSKAECRDPTTNNHEMDGLKNNGANSLDNAPSLINGDGDDLGSETADAVGELSKQQQKLVSSSTAMFDSVNGRHQTEQPLNSEKNGSRHHNSHSPESIVNTASSGAYTDEDVVISAYNVHNAIEQVTALKEDARYIYVCVCVYVNAHHLNMYSRLISSITRIMAAAKLARKVEDFLENTMASTETPRR